MKRGTDLLGAAVWALLLTVVAGSITLPVMAQTTGAATLVGTVRDSTGATVPAAKVTVVNTETSFRAETTTSATGDYYVPYLNLGTYQIVVEAAGFRRHVRDGVTLRTGETPRVDINLEVGSLTESVTVSGAAPLLATETAQASQILAGETITSMPISQRRTVRMLFYYPNTISSSGMSILGQRQRAIGYTLDGVSGKTPGTGAFDYMTATIQTTLDAVEEVKVTTSGSPAEVGHAAGGAMSVVFKSGTNELHGSFDDRYINNRFIHRSWLQQTPSTNPFVFHDISSTLSGPVYLPKLYRGKDRTFFLFGLAAHIEEAGRVGIVETVPSEEMYNGNFSFGGLGLPIYNPLSTRQDAAGKWIRDPFQGNQVPQNLFDPAVKNFLAQKPFRPANEPGVMTKTGPQQNRVGEKPQQIKRIRWDAKIDHQFSPNHKVFGRYSHAHHRADRDYTSNMIQWAAIDPSRQPIPTDQINNVFSDTLVFGPTRFNEFRLGYNRRAYSLESLTYNQDWAKQLGIPTVSPLTFPHFNLGYDLASLGRARQIGEDMTVQDNFTQITGRHTVKGGYELMRTRYNSAVQALPSGQYNFGGTDAPFTPNTGHPFASFLLGTVTSAVFTQDFATWLPRWWMHSLYVQDEWKPLRGLTLNIGVRWMYESPFNTKYGQQSQFDPMALDPLTGKPGAITHPKTALASRDLNNFQPRLGVAWNFRPKWVFRGSFGLLTQDLGVNDVNQNFLEYMGTVNIQALPGDPRHVFRLSQGPPAFTYPILADGSIPFVGQNYSARTADWYDPGLRNPYIMNWSAGLQYEFAKNWLVEMNYQASAGVGLLNNWDVNAIRLDVSNDLTVLNQIYQATQNYKPYTQFGSVRHFSNYGHNTHHSGTLKLEKRYSAGLTLVGFYTYSKTLNDTDSDGSASGITYYNRRLEKGRGGNDIRHHFVNVLTYDLPMGRGQRWFTGGVMNQVLGGWNITWTQTLESGPPATVTFSGSPYKYLPGTSRPHALVPIEQALAQDWTLGPRFPTSAQNPYLLFNSFAYPAAFTAGSLGRNVFEAPGLNWTQLTVAKSWRIKERLRFSVRFDANNMPFKQPQFSAPNSTFNANSPQTFGRITATRGQWANVGTSQSCFYLSGKVDF